MLLTHIRRAISRVPGAAAAVQLMRWASKYVRHAPNVFKSSSQIFGEYYQSNRWRNSESRSGDGSSLAATEELRRALPGLVRTLGVRTLLDLPCGDFNWMRKVDLTGVDYVGVDVVAPLIDNNNRLYSTSNVRFFVRDATRDVLPSAELVFCRDLLVHLSDDLVRATLENLRSTGAKFLVTTTFPQESENRPIITGMWRPLNLEKAPFLLPPPIQLIDERIGRISPKCIGVWDFSDLPAAARKSS